MREHRERIDRLENLIIVVLVCTALVLINQTGMFQNLTRGGTGTPVEASFTGVQDTALSRQTPVALLIQTTSGRYGVQYDQDTVDGLYNNGLSAMLTTAIDHVEGVKTTTEEDWQSAISQGDHWVLYDFLYDVAFTSQDSEGEGSARRFLLSGRNGRVDTIRYYNEKTGTYYQGQLWETGLTLPEAQEGLTPSGGELAFEDETLGQILDPNTLVLPTALVCPVYTVSNPLAAWDSETRNDLLESLDFNLRAAAVYQTTDGLVVQEGSDTLRLQKSGKLTFHAAESEPARFQALSAREKDLQIQAETLLDQVAKSRIGEGRLVCQSVETQEDGSVVLKYACLLGGSQVQLWDEGWMAKFVFEGTNLSSFVICLRAYTETEQTSQALPVRQAAAVVSAMGQQGKDLQLSYLDDGSTDMLTAQWTVRERT